MIPLTFPKNKSSRRSIVEVGRTFPNSVLEVVRRKEGATVEERPATRSCLSSKAPRRALETPLLRDQHSTALFAPTNSQTRDKDAAQMNLALGLHTLCRCWCRGWGGRRRLVVAGPSTGPARESAIGAGPGVVVGGPARSAKRSARGGGEGAPGASFAAEACKGGDEGIRKRTNRFNGKPFDFEAASRVIIIGGETRPEVGKGRGGKTNVRGCPDLFTDNR